MHYFKYHLYIHINPHLFSTWKSWIQNNSLFQFIFYNRYRIISKCHIRIICESCPLGYSIRHHLWVNQTPKYGNASRNLFYIHPCIFKRVQVCLTFQIVHMYVFVICRNSSTLHPLYKNQYFSIFRNIVRNQK